MLVIDDGSTDDTLRQIPAGVTVVSLPFNLGIGGAMQTGYRYAALHGYDVAVQVDGDGQHRPSEVRRLVEHVAAGQADLVVGSRFLEADTVHATGRRSSARLGAWMLRASDPAADRADDHRLHERVPRRQPAGDPRVRALVPGGLPRAGGDPAAAPRGLPHRRAARAMRQRRSGRSSIGVLEGVFYVLKVTACLLLDMVREPWPHEKIGGPQDIPRRVAGRRGVVLPTVTCEPADAARATALNRVRARRPRSLRRCSTEPLRILSWWPSAGSCCCWPSCVSAGIGSASGTR